MNTVRHLAIIMDGNQRWAKKNNLSIEEGYNKGFENIFNITNYAIEKKIKYLTVYALSTENIKRKSVNLLFEIINKKYKKLLEELSIKNDIKINIIGEKKNLPIKLLSIFNKIQDRVIYKKKITLNIAFNYGSDFELIEVVNKILQNNDDKKILDFKDIKNFFYLGEIPNPDILIRTGGNQRLSNFLLLYLRYTEIFFINTYWPDFSNVEFDDIINKFQNIDRSYGL